MRAWRCGRHGAWCRCRARKRSRRISTTRTGFAPTDINCVNSPTFAGASAIASHSPAEPATCMHERQIDDSRDEAPGIAAPRLTTREADCLHRWRLYGYSRPSRSSRRQLECPEMSGTRSSNLSTASSQNAEKNKSPRSLNQDSIVNELPGYNSILGFDFNLLKVKSSSCQLRLSSEYRFHQGPRSTEGFIFFAQPCSDCRVPMPKRE